MALADNRLNTIIVNGVRVFFLVGLILTLEACSATGVENLAIPAKKVGFSGCFLVLNLSFLMRGTMTNTSWIIVSKADKK